MDIKVKQKDGSITIRRNGGEPVTRHVTDHVVQVADADVDHFLAHVDGSKVVEAKTVSNKKEQ